MQSFFHATELRQQDKSLETFISRVHIFIYWWRHHETTRQGTAFSKHLRSVPEMPRLLHSQPVFNGANYTLLWTRVEICIHSANYSWTWWVFRGRSYRPCCINITRLQGETPWCSQETWSRHLGIRIAVPVNHNHSTWSTASRLLSLTPSPQSFQLFGQQRRSTTHLPRRDVPDAAGHLAESTFLTAATFTITPPPPANTSPSKQRPTPLFHHWDVEEASFLSSS